ncbi:hypothetical protein KGF54_001383 [Candida jiufengensis]|uniref:uncharacterized protein n=1 Tax=Candida jiufengensis TaxID=497108 RepID=UPI002225B011|nr:uncharacterized protein KGF54_001383 [Candida jiufengensis]KAI5955881.1 hypothetical protein KGF54_001383 [Candida jiufengensis]
METTTDQNLIHDECMICLENMEENDLIGKIPCCPTKFYHKKCIEIWSSKSNSCPTCRNRFYKILISLQSKPQSIINTLNIKDKLLPNPAINQIPSQYIINNQSIQQQLQQIIDNSLLSSNNLSNEYLNTSGSGFCCICTITNRRNNTTLLCQQCGSNFHLNCLGVSDLSEEYFNWYCPMCDYNEESIIPNNNLRSFRRTLFSSGNNNSSSSSRRQRIMQDQQPGRSVLPNQRSRLIIHNENNELNDDFLYNEDFNDDYDIDTSDEPILEFSDLQQEQGQMRLAEFPRPTTSSNNSNIINGGILLRREQKQIENLSAEEVNSWDMFDKARKESIVEETKDHQASQTVESEIPTASSTKQRRRRRKRSAEDRIEPMVVEDSNQVNAVSPVLLQPSTIQSSSRISNLIDQLKHTKKAHTSSSSSYQHYQYQHQFPQAYISNVGSQSDSSTSMGNSPMESTAYSSDDNDYTRNVGKLPMEKSYDKNESINYIEPNKQVELTYEQKLKIQRHVKNKLRLKYKPGHKIIKESSSIDNNEGFITNEEEFIKINKKISRKIYSHVLNNQNKNHSTIDEIIEDESLVQELINKYV